MMNHLRRYKPQELTATDITAFEIDLTELLTRRRFITGVGGLIGAATLGACGTDADESGDADAVRKSPPASRTITDDLGREVLVPIVPQRVVSLHDLQVMRPLLDLGVIPIASATHPAANGIFRSVEDYDVSGVESAGLIGEPNLEILLQLKPDLIIGTLSAKTDTFIDTLSDIAPTIVFDAGSSIITYHQRLADTAARLDVYDDLMQGYETQLDTLRQGIAPIRDDLLVSILAFNPSTSQIVIPEGPYMSVFEDIGIRQPTSQVDFENTDPRLRLQQISLEQLPEHDADIIFLLNWGDPSINDPLTTSPIWSTLQAVQANQVAEVNGELWLLRTVHSLFSVIDAMEQHLVDTEINTSVFP